MQYLQLKFIFVDKVPLILSCGDTFCSSCLINIQRHGKIMCADCNEITVLSSTKDGVNGLPKNNMVKELAIQLESMLFIFIYLFCFIYF